jgi:hypothetical protein
MPLGFIAKRRGVLLALAFSGFVLLCGCILGLGIVAVQSYQRSQLDDGTRIRQAVARHMLLPEEEPTVAAIKDVDKLKQSNPEFYAHAENGDFMLVFSQQAVLYSEKRDLILNVAPIIANDSQGGSSQ